MIRPLSLAGTALVAVLAAGCAGGSTTDDDAVASEEDYCDAFSAFITSVRSPESSEPQDQIDEARRTAAELAGTGAPESMPDDARLGFEGFNEYFTGLPDDVTVEEMTRRSAEVSEAEEAEVEIWRDYSYETCDVPAGDDED